MRQLLALIVSLILSSAVGWLVQEFALAVNPAAPIAANCIGIAVMAFALLALLVLISRQAGEN